MCCRGCREGGGVIAVHGDFVPGGSFAARGLLCRVRVAHLGAGQDHGGPGERQGVPDRHALAEDGPRQEKRRVEKESCDLEEHRAVLRKPRDVCDGRGFAVHGWPGREGVPV